MSSVPPRPSKKELPGTATPSTVSETKLPTLTNVGPRRPMKSQRTRPRPFRQGLRCRGRRFRQHQQGQSRNWSHGPDTYRYCTAPQTGQSQSLSSVSWHLALPNEKERDRDRCLLAIKVIFLVGDRGTAESSIRCPSRRRHPFLLPPTPLICDPIHDIVDRITSRSK